MASEAKVFAFRLGPGEELKGALERRVAEVAGSDASAWVHTCVGSLTRCKIRLANAEAGEPNPVKTLNARHEILSLVGTVSPSAGSHLHICLGDAAGNCVGGHLMGDATVFTTAEIVCGVSPAISFDRPHDEATGYDELRVRTAAGTLPLVLAGRDVVVAALFVCLGLWAAGRRRS